MKNPLFQVISPTTALVTNSSHIMILPLVQRYIYTYIKQKLSESIFFVQKYHLPW